MRRVVPEGGGGRFRAGEAGRKDEPDARNGGPDAPRQAAPLPMRAGGCERRFGRTARRESQDARLSRVRSRRKWGGAVARVRRAANDAWGSSFAAVVRVP